jgi:Uma2 family endonuclease
MATEAKAAGSSLVPYRFSVRQFERMIDAGVFPDNARLELIAGILMTKMTKSDPHDVAVAEIGETLRELLTSGWVVREEKSVVLGKRDRPEPDVAVVRGRHSDYRRRAPGVADIAFIVEVADTSYAKDRGVKWSRYARAGIPTYWIVNLPARQVEVYSGPAIAGKSASYQKAVTFVLADEVPVVVDGQEVGRIPVKDLFP